jgi:hypothetical protein
MTGGTAMALHSLTTRLEAVIEKLRAIVPSWPPAIGFEGADANADPPERRWRDEEERILPYLYWPNL